MARASGYDMKARAVPVFTTSSIFLSSSKARFPRIEKVVTPASSEVKVSVRPMIHETLKERESTVFLIIF